MLLIPSLKIKTKQQSIKTINDAVDFYLPIDAYRGEMKVLVAEGQQVLKNQLIAELDGVFSTKLHSPISGIVKGIVSIDGKKHIHLWNNFRNIEIPNSIILPEILTLENFVEILNDYGIEGSGGSRFPTQLKYRLNEKPVDTLIFNGVECEPYLSADVVLMKEKAKELLQTAKLIKHLIKAKKIVFVIEKANKDVQSILKETARILSIEIEVLSVPNTYPQGGELQVIKAVTGLEIKKGILPIDYGILVNNVGTLWAIYNAVFEGKPYTERLVTVSGNRSSQQGNYWVKIGTPVWHLLKETQNDFEAGEQNVILGGAMMGKAVNFLKTPINKGSGGLLVLKKYQNKNYNCIKCVECVTACPQKLVPFEFANHQNDKVQLQDFHLQDCIECGACAYICPSDVPLMESIMNGKKSLLQ